MNILNSLSENLASYNNSLFHQNVAINMGLVSDVAVSTIMMSLLFGTNALLFILFHFAKAAPKIDDKKEKGKELSKPFVGTIDCFANITTELFRCGLIMALTYICEKHWFFPHSGKEYSRDLFMFVLILFFAYGFYTIKPIKDLTLLGREQTEEWKGWMQFIFLLYHYFHAEEVYNSVRVMITCYVWMTGFGNFSFFYMKQDFGWLRVAQMMWRLNFAVLLLMWTHGNTYILYYICPMHTFYFLMVYATMFLFSSVNHTKWGIRVKLMVVGVLIYIIWDINNGLFDIIFGFLGTDSIVGAKGGSVWEYYFRTSLDHWSSFLGMIFALNFPLAEQYFNKAKGWPLFVAAVIIGGATIWWIVTCYSLDKLNYNLSHSYFAIIPLSSYIFFRNITPGIRSGVSMSLHDLGKTTLETYLLQHHIWLTSNAKTLLTITPGHPWINFALATMLFFTVSKELYRITMSLRGMVMPDDKNITFTNCIGMGLILSMNYAIALLLHFFHATMLELLLACFGLFLVSVFMINKFSRGTAENYSYQIWSNRLASLVGLLILVGILTQLVLNGLSPHPATGVDVVKGVAFKGNSVDCLSAISKGSWISVKCPEQGKIGVSIPSKMAYCKTEQWQWHTPDYCPIANIGTTKARSIFKTKRVIFMGDSIVRNVYYQFNSLIDPSYNKNASTAMKHSDLKFVSKVANTSILFLWAPMVSNITNIISSNSVSNADLIVLGSAAWDALYKRDVASYKRDLDSLSDLISKGNNSSRKSTYVWLQPTTIIDTNLITPEKKKFMGEETIEKYRQTFLESKLSKDMKTILDVTAASFGREAIDGIHYNQDVYSVIAQMTLNAYSLHFPTFYSSQKKAAAPPKKTGSMSFPSYGAFVLLLSAIMIFSMDSFLGIGFLSLKIFNRSLDWEAAYGPLHKKILKPDGVLGEAKVAPVTNELDSLLGGNKEPEDGDVEKIMGQK